MSKPGPVKIFLRIFKKRAGIAQLVEQWFCKPKVGSSILSAGTMNQIKEGLINRVFSD